MKIKLSKSQWEMIGQKTGWKIAQSTRYYLETHIDGKEMLGSDGTWVLHSLKNINKEVNAKIKQLISLSKEVSPYITKAKNITLKLTDRSENVLKTFDITKNVLQTNTVESKIQEKMIEKTAGLKTPNPYKVGDKVTLKEDVLQRHSRSVPPQAGYTKEQFAWRDVLGKLIGKVGTVSRILPDSKYMGIDFDGEAIGIDFTEVNPA